MHFLEFEQRAHTGEAIDKESWDLDRIALAIPPLITKYNLTWDKNNLLPCDDHMCKRFYAAGRELLIASGIYNISTGRIIKFEPEEIDAAAQNQRIELIMGRGKDAFKLFARKPGDTRKPAVFGGNPGCPTPERVFYQNVRSLAQEPAIDLLTCGSLADVDGYPVRFGEASELLAVRREIMYLDQASADCGRGGMGRLTAQSAVSVVGDLAAYAEGFIRGGDAHLVALNNELIVNNDNIVRAAGTADTGVYNASLACVMVGGLAGGAPGAAVVMIASMLAANLIGDAHYHLCHPIHIRYTATTTLECMWVQSVVCQAFNLCAPNIVVCDIYPKSGAMTPELLYEVAANALVITASGGHLEGVGGCDGLKPHGTGLEARLMGEIGRFASAAAMERSAANEAALALYDKYKHVFINGNEGAPFERAYDMETIRPVKEWLAMYIEARKTLNKMGILI